MKGILPDGKESERRNEDKKRRNTMTEEERGSKNEKRTMSF